MANVKIIRMYREGIVYIPTPKVLTPEYVKNHLIRYLTSDRDFSRQYQVFLSDDDIKRLKKQPDEIVDYLYRLLNLADVLAPTSLELLEYTKAQDRLGYWYRFGERRPKGVQPLAASAVFGHQK